MRAWLPLAVVALSAWRAAAAAEAGGPVPPALYDAGAAGAGAGQPREAGAARPQFVDCSAKQPSLAAKQLLYSSGSGATCGAVKCAIELGACPIELGAGVKCARTPGVGGVPATLRGCASSGAKAEADYRAGRDTDTASMYSFESEGSIVVRPTIKNLEFSVTSCCTPPKGSISAQLSAKAREKLPCASPYCGSARYRDKDLQWRLTFWRGPKGCKFDDANLVKSTGWLMGNAVRSDHTSDDYAKYNGISPCWNGKGDAENTGGKWFVRVDARECPGWGLLCVHVAAKVYYELELHLEEARCWDWLINLTGVVLVGASIWWCATHCDDNTHKGTVHVQPSVVVQQQAAQQPRVHQAQVVPSRS